MGLKYVHTYLLAVSLRRRSAPVAVCVHTPPRHVHSSTWYAAHATARCHAMQACVTHLHLGHCEWLTGVLHVANYVQEDGCTKHVQRHER